MTRAYNNSLVLVRFLAVLLICFGVLGFAFISLTQALVLIGFGRALTDPAHYYSAQSLVASPIYIVAGVLLLSYSVRVARFIAKNCEPEAVSPPTVEEGE
jgi:uncharacterized membrane protein